MRLPKRTEREDAQLFMQRYAPHFPPMARSSSSARAGIGKRQQSSCWGNALYEQHSLFLETCPLAEKYLIDAGIRLIKLWVEIGPEGQERRLGRPPGRSDAAMEGRGV